MVQISVLQKKLRWKKFIKKSRLCEKKLQESREKIHQLTRQLSDSNKTMQTCCFKATANGTLSNISFVLKHEEVLKKKHRTFFVCTASLGADVRITNAVEPKTNVITFEDAIQFDKLSTSFVIDIKIFSIKYKKRSSRSAKGLLQKMFLRDEALESNFKLCAKFKITENQKNEEPVNICNEEDSPLERKATYKLAFTDISIDHKVSGFVNIGRVFKSKFVLWNMHWCVLDGGSMKVYRSPIDEHFDRADFEIRLKSIAGYRVARENECTKRRTLKLTLVDVDGDKPIEETYYFTPNSYDDYHRWYQSLSYVIKILSNWRMLQFYQEPVVKKETVIY